MKQGLLSALIVSLSIFAAAQSRSAPDRGHTGNPVLTAKLLLKAVYPELTERHLRTVIMDDEAFEGRSSLHSFTMVLCVPPPKKAELLPPPPDPFAKPTSADICPEEVFHASFVFPNSDAFPREFRYHDAEMYNKIRVLERMFEDHRSWTYRQRIETLKESGMMFGPDDKPAFLRNFPTKGLENVFGVIRILSAEFSPKPYGIEGSAVLYWAVNFETHQPNGEPVIYTAWANPINGKVETIEAKGDGGRVAEPSEPK